jgi:hypothetical protein
MPKYKIYATKTIQYEVIVDAETEYDAYKVSDEFIIDDFDQMSTVFKIDNVVLQSA